MYWKWVLFIPDLAHQDFDLKRICFQPQKFS
eukprot:COSAG02_NODE_21411_length_789_cov_0.839130_1_plen_30_part_10